MINDIMSTMTLKDGAVTVGIYVPPPLETLHFKGSAIEKEYRAS